MKLLERDRLANSTKEMKDSIEIVLSAYRSVVGDLTYVSMPITSGKKMYEILKSLGLKSQDELKTKMGNDFIYEQLIKPNIKTGTRSAEEVAKVNVGPVIAPAYFEARKQRWNQDEYMAMWLAMIEEKVNRVVLLDGWEFSNGGSEEYLHSVQMQAGFRSRTNMEIVSQDMKGVTLDKGTTLIGAALEKLHDQGCRSETLVDVFRSLVTVEKVFRCPEIMAETPYPAQAFFNYSSVGFDNAVKNISKLIKEDYGIESLFKSISTSDGIIREFPENVIIKKVES